MKRKPRVYALGDIHGNYNALIDVLKKSNFNYENDTLYFLGDLADGHPYPSECLHELMKIKNFYPIMGNHDLFLKEWIYDKKVNNRWLKLGAYETIKFFEDDEDLLKQYFEKTQYYVIYNDNFLCHGGFNHKRLITKQKKINFCINRTLYQTSFSYEKIGIKFKPIYDENNSQKIKYIVIGHSPTKNYLPCFNSNLINIDTDAGNRGKLTLLDLDNHSFYQSKKNPH